MSEDMSNRRDVKTRKITFFQNLARWLVQKGFTPNQVSVSSSVFALIGAVTLATWNRNHLGYVASAVIMIVMIQLRLICNLIDGLMAVEGGKKTPAGEIFNDVPDRISDMLFFVGVGYAYPDFWNLQWAWEATFFAAMTAYVRVLGASMGHGHDFGGPFAKQHRMFWLCLTLVESIFEYCAWGTIYYSLLGGMVIIALGSLLTVVLRLYRLTKKINGAG